MTLKIYDGVVLGLPDKDYHSRTELSSTGARLLLDSPAKFQYAQTHPQPHKEAFDLGTAVHTKVLGTGAAVIGIPDEHLTPSGNVATKAATVEWLAEQREAGVIVLTRSHLRQVDGMAEAVLSHPTARALFEQEGNAEASVFSSDPETGVAMRARLDWLGTYCADLKTTAKSASPADFEKTVVNFQYDVQEAHYSDTLKFAGEPERPFLFVVVETDAPHLVGVYQLDTVFRQMGKAKAKRARELYAACTTTGEWPGYPTEVQSLSPPTWAVYQHEEKYA